MGWSRTPKSAGCVHDDTPRCLGCGAVNHGPYTQLSRAGSGLGALPLTAAIPPRHLNATGNLGAVASAPGVFMPGGQWGSARRGGDAGRAARRKAA